MKRIYTGVGRYNERLNTETGGSKTPCLLVYTGLHRKHTVNLVPVVTEQGTVGLVRGRRSRNQST
jgi:hypothetical protein